MNRREAITSVIGVLLTPHISFPSPAENETKFIRIDLTNTDQIHLYSKHGNLSFYKHGNYVTCNQRGVSHYIPMSKDPMKKQYFLDITKKSIDTPNKMYFEIIIGNGSNLYCVGY